MSDKRATLVSAVVIVGAIALALSVGLIFLKVNPETRYNFRNLQRVERDLAKVKRILGNFVVVVEHPQTRKTIHRIPSLDKQSGSSPTLSAPSNASGDQAGVTPTSKPHVAPESPVQAQGGSPPQTPEQPETKAAEQPAPTPEAPVAPPEATESEGATRVAEKPRIELPTVPIPVVLEILDTEGLP